MSPDPRPAAPDPTDPVRAPELNEFHQDGGWLFKRLDDGSVRIRHGEYVHLIPPNEWESVVWCMEQWQKVNQAASHAPQWVLDRLAKKSATQQDEVNSLQPAAAAPDPARNDFKLAPECEGGVCQYGVDVGMPGTRCGGYCHYMGRAASLAAAPDVPAEEPSAEQVKSWCGLILELVLPGRDWLPSIEQEFRALVDALPLLIQRAHDAEVRATKNAAIATSTAVASTRAVRRQLELEDALRDAEQRIAALTSERSALRGKIEAEISEAHRVSRESKVAMVVVVTGARIAALELVLAQLPAEDETSTTRIDADGCHPEPEL